MDSWTTGMLASGNACTSTDHVPWSMPHESTSAPTHVGVTTSLTFLGELGQARCRVLHVEQLAGEAVEVVSVRGRGIAVTVVALMYQCAEMTRIARGRGTALPNACQALVYRLVSGAFIGLP
jgi:hypothetical protein